MPRRLALVLVLLATSCGHSGTRVFTVPSASMEPSIHQGDSIGCSTKVPALLPRGAVVVFKGSGTAWAPESSSQRFTKRVVGLPGETVSGDARGVTVGGTVLTEPYADQDGQTFGPVTVPNGEYFLMGDNRAHSSDSRYNGTVPHSAVVATCTRIVAPKAHRGRIPGT